MIDAILQCGCPNCFPQWEEMQELCLLHLQAALSKLLHTPSTQHTEHLLHVPGSDSLFPTLEEASELLNLALYRRSLVQLGAEVLGRGGVGGLDE